METAALSDLIRKLTEYPDRLRLMNDEKGPAVNDIQLSETDRRIVNALARYGKLPYQELAERVGIPTSTCHGRVRALEQRGVIAGYRVDINPDAIGHNVSALILLSVHNHQRDRVPGLSEELRNVPGVQQIFLIGGDKDLVVHVTCKNVTALRELLSEHFGRNPVLSQTQTLLVFDHQFGNEPA